MNGSLVSLFLLNDFNGFKYKNNKEQQQQQQQQKINETKIEQMFSVNFFFC